MWYYFKKKLVVKPKTCAAEEIECILFSSFTVSAYLTPSMKYAGKQTYIDGKTTTQNTFKVQ